MIKVLFVCLGNFCRSPTAEGILRDLVLKRGLADKFVIDSAGTGSHHIGSPPDLRSQQEAQKHHIDISNLRARLITEHDFAFYDYIFAMDKYNLASLSQLCPKEYQHKITLILEFHPDPQWQEVPDPYYNSNGFGLVFELLQVANEKFLASVLPSAKIS